MDAALIELGSGFRFRVGRDRCPRHNHIGRRQCLAFGSFDIISRSLVERRDDAAAERRNFGEGVNLTAVVRRGDGLTDSDRQIGRRELPRGDLLRRVQLAVELGKRDAPLFGARASAQRRVERCRVTLILDADCRVGPWPDGVGARSEDGGGQNDSESAQSAIHTANLH